MAEFLRRMKKREKCALGPKMGGENRKSNFLYMNWPFPVRANEIDRHLYKTLYITKVKNLLLTFNFLMPFSN